MAGGALVAWTAAVGTGVGAAVGAVPLVDGAVVAVGGGDVAAGNGVAVAEDPQANSRATNNRTIALGKCLIIRGLDLDIGTFPSLLLRCYVLPLNYRQSSGERYFTAISKQQREPMILYATVCGLSIR